MTLKRLIADIGAHKLADDDWMLDAEERVSAAPQPKQKFENTTENPKVPERDEDHKVALERYHRGWEHDRHNIERAYQDLNFLAGFQWLQELENQRLQDGRPVLTFNRVPQFVRQVTGDIRQMRPAIKVVPVSSGADEKIAEIREGLIRHIEQASDATLDVYVDGADSQVSCGIGHWEVAGDYSEETDYEQNLVIRILDDQVAVIWDPDSRKKTRQDAVFCFVPVDMTRDAYKNAYPTHPVNDMGTWDGQYIDNWYDDDHIRVCRYWYKVKITRKLVKMPDGSVVDVTDKPEQAMELAMAGGLLFEREGSQVYHRMMNGNEFLTEPQKWPGRYIPIIPIMGEEVRIGGRIERHGIVRFLQDPQRAYNYARSTETEFVGLQPKAPYIGTAENFKDYTEEWDTANVKNWPYLQYTPDPKNGNIAPQRLAPPSTSPGIEACILNAINDMQGVVGIYNSSLGAKSNEDSGVAIQSREAQSDTGTYVYMANFALAVTHTARVINDLIPHYYDTERTIRIVGMDGKSRQVQINQPGAGLVVDGVTDSMMNDITVGSYDIQMEMGPSYATQREAARAGMGEFVKAFPPAAPILADMFADLQDWPRKEEVAERLRTLLPPNIQQQLAEKDGKPPPPPPQPDPTIMAEAQAKMAESQSKVATSQLEVRRKELEVAKQQLDNARAEIELVKAQSETSLNPQQVQQFLTDADFALRTMSEHLAGQFEAPGQEQEEPEAEGPSEIEMLKAESLRQKLRHDEESHDLKMKQAKREKQEVD
jgi:hypothetical protein